MGSYHNNHNYHIIGVTTILTAINIIARIFIAVINAKIMDTIILTIIITRVFRPENDQRHHHHHRDRVLVYFSRFNFPIMKNTKVFGLEIIFDVCPGGFFEKGKFFYKKQLPPSYPPSNQEIKL